MTSSSNTETQTVVNEQNKTVAYASFLLHSMPLFSQAARFTVRQLFIYKACSVFDFGYLGIKTRFCLSP